MTKNNQKNKKDKRANALVTVLGVLFIISATAVSFTKIATVSMFAADNHNNAIKARLISEAGIQLGIAKLRRDFQQEIFSTLAGFEHRPELGESEGERNWCYTGTENSTSLGKDDVTAAGVPLEEIFNAHPSYAIEVNGKKISGAMDLGEEKIKEPFFLKIFDTTSQLNLNSQSIHENHPIPFPEVLNNLSRAIAKRAPYKNDFTEDELGPLASESGEMLGEAIVNTRENLGGRFSSKYDLLQVPGIIPDKIDYLFDFITVHSISRDNVISRNFKAEFANEEEPFQGDSRAPININTASWPVLVAIFQGVSHFEGPFDSDGNNLSAITQEEAEKLADLVCEERVNNKPFGGWEFEDNEWQSFRGFIESNAIDIFEGSDELKLLKARLLYANADPNTSLRRLNPDRPAWQVVNKTDLDFYTTEFCFYPQGTFEITSLGQLLDSTGELVHQTKTFAAVKIFDLLHKSTQVDFQDDQRVDNLTTAYNEKKVLNAFSYVNNLQKNGSTTESNFFGYVQPVVFDLKYGIDQLDRFVGDGNLTFKANFNNGRDGIITELNANPMDADRVAQGGNPALLSPPSYTGLNQKTSDFPASGDWSANIEYSDLLVDGVLFNESGFGVAPEDEEKLTLCYQANGNIPNGEIGQREGMLMFWFKLNENPNWNPNDWRTIFFSTSVFEDTPSDEESGIQMEVQMRWNKADGVFELQARRKLYRIPKSEGGTLTDPDETTVPTEITFLDSGVRYQYRQAANLGVNPHEWYHAAIMWQSGTDLELQSSPEADAIILSGNFYDSDEATEPSLIGNATFSGAFLPYDQGDELGGENLLVNNPNTLEALFDIEGNLKPGIMAPLEEKETRVPNGRFYIGAVFRQDQVHSSDITIDDIRVAKNPQEVDFIAYNPSRYPPFDTGPIEPMIGKFNAAFNNQPTESVVLGVLDWTKRTPFGTSDPEPFIDEGDGDVVGGNSPVADFAYSPISRWNPNAKKGPMVVSRRPHKVAMFVWEHFYREIVGEKPNGMSDREFRGVVRDFGLDFGKEIKKTWNEGRSKEEKKRIPKLEHVNRFHVFDSNVIQYFRDIIPEATVAVVGNGTEVEVPEVEEEEDPGNESGPSDQDPVDQDPVDQDPDLDPEGIDGEITPEEAAEILLERGEDGEGELPEESQLKPIKSPGQALAGDGQIKILAPEAAFDFQLRFVQSRQPDDSLSPQFLSPLVDDVSLTYQSNTQFLEQRFEVED